MTNPNLKRRYHSPRRQAQAEATRRQVVEAARHLFALHGYAATTLPAIAAEAGVSTATVTAQFGTKLALLDSLIKINVRGDADPAELAVRAWWQEMLAEPDPLQQLRRYAAITRQIHERTVEIAEIVRGAATADPEIAALRRRLGESHLQDAHQVADSLAEKGALSADVTVARAADLLWALGSSEMYRVLVVDRGWSPAEYERWLASALIAELLAQPSHPQRGNG